MGMVYKKVTLLLALSITSIIAPAQNAQEDSFVQSLPSAKVNRPNGRSQKGKVVEYEEVIYNFYLKLDEIPYLSGAELQTMKTDVQRYTEALKDRDNDYKQSYIEQNKLEEYVADAQYNLRKNREELQNIVDTFLDEKYSKVTINEEQACKDELFRILNDVISERDSIISVLQESMRYEISESVIEKLWNKSKYGLKQLKPFALQYKNHLEGAAVAFLVLGIWLLIILKSKKKKSPSVSSELQLADSDKNTGIVVRRKTQAILKKQSLDDVHDNPAYMVINCSDFCDDSAVRRIYIKNTCILDIYNMYAEDLRKTDDPCEDGCMVLGRWVYDDQNDEYYVSLEEIVRPGDDAVLQEYELNFGGKIKLKVSERLRKLRRETNLQYDLTCWVHSHPGLGVFFSQADNSVHMQLKHPTHPKFLTAIVVDILTRDQELAIFTFKHDQTINSKPEIYKMYSLEKMYKWAIESDKNSLKEENYYNITQNVQSKNDAFHDILLSSSTIIDMCLSMSDQRAGMQGVLCGCQREYRQRVAYVSESLKHGMSATNDECCGCFVIGTHRSIPSIRKAIADNIEKIHFVLFLSTVDGLVTSIPVNEGQISVDESLYGEAKLEELKLWTRRKG